MPEEAIETKTDDGAVPVMTETVSALLTNDEVEAIGDLLAMVETDLAPWDAAVRSPIVTKARALVARLSRFKR